MTRLVAAETQVGDAADPRVGLRLDVGDAALSRPDRDVEVQAVIRQPRDPRVEWAHTAALAEDRPTHVAAVGEVPEPVHLAVRHPCINACARSKRPSVIACSSSPVAVGALPAQARACVPSRTMPSLKQAMTVYQRMADRSRVVPSA